MSNLYPTSLNSYPTGVNSPKLSDMGHVSEHNALEAKVGVDNSAVTTSLDYLLKSTSSTNPGHKHTAANGASDKTFPSGTIVGTTDTQVLTNKDLTSGTNSFPTTLVTLTGSQTLTNKVVIQEVATYTPVGAGTTTLDLSTGNIQNVTMPAATQTLAVSNAAAGQCFIVEINNVTAEGALTWFSTIRWVNGVTPTLTGTNGKRDVFGFRVTGVGTYDGYIVGQNI